MRTLFTAQVLEQILAVLLRLVKEFKLQHQHDYVRTSLSRTLFRGDSEVHMCLSGLTSNVAMAGWNAEAMAVQTMSNHEHETQVIYS